MAHQPSPARRFRRRAWAEVNGQRLPVADAAWVRALGLAWLSRERAGPGLLIPRCRSVHSFGMRFDLELRFLDATGCPIRVVERLRPNRLACCRDATAVLELPAPRRGQPPAEGASLAPPSS